MVAQRESSLQTSLLGVFAFLLLGIGVANFVFYRAESTASREHAMAQLTAIADLKASKSTTGAANGWAMRCQPERQRLDRADPRTLAGWRDTQQAEAEVPDAGCQRLSPTTTTAMRR